MIGLSCPRNENDMIRVSLIERQFTKKILFAKFLIGL